MTVGRVGAWLSDRQGAQPAQACAFPLLRSGVYGLQLSGNPYTPELILYMPIEPRAAFVMSFDITYLAPRLLSRRPLRAVLPLLRLSSGGRLKVFFSWFMRANWLFFFTFVTIKAYK